LRKRVSLLALVGLLASLMVVPLEARAEAQRVYEIATGTELSGSPAFTPRFFPSRLTAHEGDILHFDYIVMVLPEGRTEPEDGYDAFVEEKEPGKWGINFNLFGSELPEEGCGTTEANACVYTGDRILAPEPEDFENYDGFYVKIGPGQDGNSIFVSNLIRRLRVDVDGTKAQSPVEDPTAAAKLANLTEDAKALHRKLQDRQTFHRDAKGRKVWDAYAGFETREIVLLDMYPRKLRIRKGQRVQWHFGQLNFEPHTVSMPRGRAINVAMNTFNKFEDPTWDGILPDNFVFKKGDGRFPATKSSFESSGLRGGSNAPTDDPWTVRFTAKSPKKGFRYLCMLHPFMEGSVHVRK
jgi:hypothetical protein